MKTAEAFQKKNRFRIAEAAVMIGVMALLSCLFDYRYAMNDDVYVNAIISGRYSGVPDIHNVSLGTPLNMLFCLLYRICPYVCWFGGAMVFCQFYSLYSIMTLLGKKLHLSEKYRLPCIAAMNVLFLGIMINELVIVQYTYTAALLMASAILRLYGMEGNFFEKKNLRCFAGLLFQLLFTYCLRTEIFLFLLPFAALLMLVQYYRANGLHLNKSDLKKWLVIWGSILCGVIVMYAVNAGSYAEQDWKEYKMVDEYRTRLYDFLALPEYSQNQEFYDEAGISEAQYRLLENYNFTLDDEITWETLSRVVDYADEQRISEYQGIKKLYYQMFTLPLGEGIWSYGHRLMFDPAIAVGDAPWNYVSVTLYIILFAAACLSGRFHTIVSMVMMLLLRSGLWMYLILRQRVPVRVTHSLFLAEIVCLLVLIFEELSRLRESGSLKKAKLLCAGISVIFLAGAGAVAVSSCGSFYKTYRETAAYNEGWQELLEYCREREENFYFMDVYSTVNYSETIFEDNRVGTDNYDICGGWLAKSPLCDEKYAKFGITSVSEALMQNENVFFVAEKDRDLQWLCDLYAEWGVTVAIEGRDTVAEQFEVYKIVQK